MPNLRSKPTSPVKPEKSGGFLSFFGRKSSVTPDNKQTDRSLSPHRRRDSQKRNDKDRSKDGRSNSKGDTHRERRDSRSAREHSSQSSADREKSRHVDPQPVRQHERKGSDNGSQHPRGATTDCGLGSNKIGLPQESDTKNYQRPHSPQIDQPGVHMQNQQHEGRRSQHMVSPRHALPQDERAPKDQFLAQPAGNAHLLQDHGHSVKADYQRSSPTPDSLQHPAFPHQPITSRQPPQPQHHQDQQRPQQELNVQPHPQPQPIVGTNYVSQSPPPQTTQQHSFHQFVHQPSSQCVVMQPAVSISPPMAGASNNLLPSQSTPTMLYSSALPYVPPTVHTKIEKVPIDTHDLDSVGSKGIRPYYKHTFACLRDAKQVMKERTNVYEIHCTKCSSKYDYLSVKIEYLQDIVDIQVSTKNHSPDIELPPKYVELLDKNILLGKHELAHLLSLQKEKQEYKRLLSDQAKQKRFADGQLKGTDTSRSGDAQIRSPSRVSSEATSFARAASMAVHQIVHTGWDMSDDEDELDDVDAPTCDSKSELTYESPFDRTIERRKSDYLFYVSPTEDSKNNPPLPRVGRVSPAGGYLSRQNARAKFSDNGKAGGQSQFGPVCTTPAPPPPRPPTPTTRSTPTPNQKSPTASDGHSVASISFSAPMTTPPAATPRLDEPSKQGSAESSGRKLRKKSVNSGL